MVVRIGVPPICIDILQSIDGIDFSTVYSGSIEYLVDNEVPPRYISADWPLAVHRIWPTWQQSVEPVKLKSAGQNKNTAYPNMASPYLNGLCSRLFQKYPRIITLATAA